MSEEFENLSRVHDAFPDKHLIFTEGCIEGGPQMGEWHTGERYGRNIIGDLNNHLELWIDWNLVLNEEDGPNHVGNYCDAPVIVDTKKDEVYNNSSYYYIGHFSKFIKHVARRIGIQASNNRLLATALENINGETVAVLMNENDSREEVSISLGGKSMMLILPKHSVATIIIY